MNANVAVIMLVGIALSSSIGLGLVALDPLEDTRPTIVQADSQAYDADGDGHADGVLVYVHSQDPGTVRLEILEDGEVLGETTARDWRAGAPFAPCSDERRTLDTRALGRDAGTITVQPCHDAPDPSTNDTGDDGPCDEDDGCTTDPEYEEGGCELLGVETQCLV